MVVNKSTQKIAEPKVSINPKMQAYMAPIFQKKMGTLMHDLEYVRAYIDDLLILTSGDLTDHLEKLGERIIRSA